MFASLHIFQMECMVSCLFDQMTCTNCLATLVSVPVQRVSVIAILDMQSINNFQFKANTATKRLALAIPVKISLCATLETVAQALRAQMSMGRRFSDEVRAPPGLLELRITMPFNVRNFEIDHSAVCSFR